MHSVVFRIILVKLSPIGRAGKSDLDVTPYIYRFAAA